MTYGYTYVGEFRDDRKHGHGTFTFPDGRKYIGAWVDDKYEGFGTFYNSDGTVRENGIWKAGRLVIPMPFDPSIN